MVVQILFRNITYEDFLIWKTRWVLGCSFSQRAYFLNIHAKNKSMLYGFGVLEKISYLQDYQNKKEINDFKSHLGYEQKSA